VREGSAARRAFSAASRAAFRSTFATRKPLRAMLIERAPHASSLKALLEYGAI
jgi:hypothetical protein